MKHIIAILTFSASFSFNATAQCDSSLIVKKEVVIPNVFTPDNDGFNDGFNGAGDCITSIDKQIYNRWGELIFETKMNWLARQFFKING